MSSFGGALQMRFRATSSTSHTNRLIHPYIVKCNTAVHSKHVGPLYVRATLWHENDKEVEITYYTTTSQRCNGTGMTVLWESLRARTFRCPAETLRFLENSLQGKEGIFCPFSLLVGAASGTSRVSRVSSWGRWQGVCCLCSLLEELIKLWKEKKNKTYLSHCHVQLRIINDINQMKEERKLNSTDFVQGKHMQLFVWIVIRASTFTGHPFLSSISFLLRRKQVIQ